MNTRWQGDRNKNKSIRVTSNTTKLIKQMRSNSLKKNTKKLSSLNKERWENTDRQE